MASSRLLFAILSLFFSHFSSLAFFFSLTIARFPALVLSKIEIQNINCLWKMCVLHWYVVFHVIYYMRNKASICKSFHKTDLNNKQTTREPKIFFLCERKKKWNSDVILFIHKWVFQSILLVSSWFHKDFSLFRFSSLMNLLQQYRAIVNKTAPEFNVCLKIFSYQKKCHRVHVLSQQLKSNWHFQFWFNRKYTWNWVFFLQ